MKKSLFLSAVAAALVLSSCSNDEILSSQPQSPIGFDSFVGKTTRATDADKTNLMRMTVYGYIGDATPVKNFDGTIVSRTSATADWTYSPLQYWTAGKDYFFTALSSPVSEGNNHYSYTWAETLTTDIAAFNGSGTISFNNGAAAGNEDLVYAFATKTTPAAITTSPGMVEFAFKHALSRVKFSFVNAMESDAYSVKVYGLSIDNAVATGDLVLGDAEPEWSNLAENVKLTLRDNLYTPTTQVAANTAKVVSGTKFIIPGKDILKISFSVDLMVNGSKIATYVHAGQALPETAFKNGHSYNFVATLTPNNIDPDNDMFPIEFDVISVDEWTEEADIPVELPENSDPTPGA